MEVRVVVEMEFFLQTDLTGSPVLCDCVDLVLLAEHYLTFDRIFHHWLTSLKLI